MAPKRRRARTTTRRAAARAPYETIRYAVADQIATVTLDRPRVRNAQNTRLILELDRAMHDAAADPAVRVIVLAANGPAFSAGHDLKAVVGQEAPDEWRRLRATAEGRLRHERELYVEKCLYIQQLPKPTIAQVQGPCVAAGDRVTGQGIDQPHARSDGEARRSRLPLHAPSVHARDGHRAARAARPGSHRQHRRHGAGARPRAASAARSGAVPIRTGSRPSRPAGT